MAAADPSKKPMLEHALEYLKLGYPIFPVCSPLMGAHQHGSTTCSSPGKRPLVAWEPYQTRLPTEADVRRWWSSEPRANIGLATGARSGVIVLDCDSGEARSLAMEKGGLDRTPAVWTGKPGGIHYWLAHPGEEVRNFARRLPGTDLRGDGGYVLLPPSRHVSGADYRWNEHTLGMEPKPIPPWLWELLRGGSGSSSSDDGKDQEPLDLTAILNGVSEGSRDDTLYRYACKMRGDNVPQAYAEQMIRQAARLCKPAFDEDEAVSKVTHAYEDFKPNADWSSLIEDDEETVEARIAEEPLPQPFLRPVSELLAMPEVEPDWLVNQLFTVGSNGWVAAEPKVGKSWTVLELVYALSTGNPFLGKFAVKQPRRVIYIQEEDSLQRVLRRLKKLLKGEPGREPPSDEYLRWSIRSGFKLDSQSWLDRLQDELRAYPAEVVVLDVFNMLHGLEENKQSDMTALLNTMMSLNRIFGCAFIVVHHNRKPQAGNEARGNQMIRGSGVLAGWGECSLYLRRSKEKNTIIVTPESKDCPEMDDFTIAIQDTENGGVVLEMGDVEATDNRSKADIDVIDMVQSITDRGIGATAKLIAESMGKDRTTVQRRLTRLAEAGYLTATPISSNHNPTILYAVVSR